MHRNDSAPHGYCQCGCGQKAPLAPKTSARKGWVKGEPVRYVYGHFNPRNPQHGTRNEYQRHGCRCNACREAERIYNSNRAAQDPKIREVQLERSRRYAKRYPDRRAEAARQWRERHPEAQAAGQRRRSMRFRLKQYALTAEAHALLLTQQSGVCAICGAQDNRELSVDHEHVTGRVRGLLCRRCNLGLGCFGDDAELLSAAIRYLHTMSIAPTE